MSPDRRTLLALFSIAFGLRVVYAAFVGLSPALNPHPQTFDFDVARHLAATPGLILHPFSPSAPGYELLLAAVFRVTGAHVWSVVILQAILGAATVLLVYRIGERCLGAGVGLASALWLAIYVHHMHFVSIIARDVLVTLLLVWMVYAMVRPFHKMRQAIWVAVIYTLLIHTDSQYLLFLPVLVVFFAFASTHHRLLNVQYLFLFLVAVFVLSLPWTIRNTIVYRELTPIALEARSFLPRSQTPATARPPATGAPEHTALGRNSLEFWRAVRFRAQPADSTRGTRLEPAWSVRHNLISGVEYGLLLPFFVVGLAVALWRRHRAALVVAGTVAVYYLMRAFLGGGERQRFPVEPLIILLAFYGLFAVVQRIRSGGAVAPRNRPTALAR